MVKVIVEASEVPQTGPVVIDFFAQWCGPCKKIAPFFEQLADEYVGVTFLKVDVDESEDLVRQYNISAMPTFIFLKDGVVKKKVEGADVRGLEMGFALMK